MSPVVFSLHTTAYFFVYGWRIDTYIGLSITILLVVMAGMIFEGFQSLRHLHLRARTERYKISSATKQRTLAIRTHVERSLLNMLHVTTSYLLMLCAMSYNVWIMTSVLLGASLGYFFVRPVVLHLLQQKKKYRKEEMGKALEVTLQFLNGVNGKSEPKISYVEEETDSEIRETRT